MKSVVTYSDMQDDAGLKAMIAGYMDKGFLENIIKEAVEDIMGREIESGSKNVLYMRSPLDK